MQAVANSGRRKRVRVDHITIFFSIGFFNMTDTISCQVVPEAERMAFVDRLFGINFPMRLEPTVFDMAGMLSSEYHGGYWQFYALSNDGFYMAPSSDANFDVYCENGFEGKLSADALGLAACLYGYSHLSFGGDTFADLCGNQYHLAREFMFQHPEAKSILLAID
jgi:hypothetical protein